MAGWRIGVGVSSTVCIGCTYWPLFLLPLLCKIC
jgi:hypothetical protein